MAFDQDITSEDSEPMPGDYFPKPKPYYEKFVKRLAGFDIKKDSYDWLALVATEDTTKNNKKSVRLYRWSFDRGDWQTGSCTMKIENLDFEDISKKVLLLKKNYEIK